MEGTKPLVLLICAIKFCKLLTIHSTFTGTKETTVCSDRTFHVTPNNVIKY